MKKFTTTLVLITSFFAFSQKEESVKTETNYNRWSIDINTGLSRPTAPFTDGYFVEDFSLFHVDLGARYMFNPKFGLKADIGYDSYDQSKNSLSFKGKYYRTGLNGVVNIGRVLNFEDFAERINFQLHVGFGYSFMTTPEFNGKDEMTNVPLGLTLQYRISNRVAFNADFTMINNISQHYTFDGLNGGVDGEIIKDRGFNSTLYNATIGLSIYLGKNEKHADWVSSNSRMDDLERRIAELEAKILDSDNDGVADYVDLEPTTLANAIVDTKGRTVDTNSNNVDDNVEVYVNDKIKAIPAPKNGQSIEDMINGGYVNVYFDTNETKPTPESYDAINFVVQYLRSNPNSSVDVMGYADEVGNSDYNKTLSTNRANFVKDVIVKSGIDSSRFTIIGQGEDTSVDVKSKEARRIVRRVTFKLK